MKKVILIIVVIICVGILTILAVNKFTPDSDTTTASAAITSVSPAITSVAPAITSASSATITSESANSSAVSSNTVKNEAPGGKAEIVIGSVSGAAESTVLIPISVKTVPDKGIGSCNFNIKYDTNILEVVDVLPGDAIGNNIANLDYSNIDVTGIVSFLYTSSNNGKDSITKPGVITNVKFKIKKDAKKGVYKISNGTTGAFGDVSLNKINAVFTEGEITVK